jgi:hypothetical protein
VAYPLNTLKIEGIGFCNSWGFLKMPPFLTLVKHTEKYCLIMSQRTHVRENRIFFSSLAIMKM